MNFSALTIQVNEVKVDFGGNGRRFGQGGNRWSVSRKDKSGRKAGYFDEINAKDSIVHFAHLYGPTHQEGPEPMRGGKTLIETWREIPDDVQARLNQTIERVRADLAERGRPDEFQAIQSEHCDLTDTTDRIIKFMSAQFSTIEALRQFRGSAGKDVFALPTILRPPRVLSANVLLVCSERKQLIVQHRGDVATYPHHLHVFGGAFRTSDPGAGGPAQIFSDISFFGAALRELQEETGYTPAEITAPMFVISREVDTGYLQFNMLGLDIPERALDRLRETWEGKIARIPLDHLPAALGSGRYSVDGGEPLPFVPSGRALMLAWLAEGAPTMSLTAKKRPYFSAAGKIDRAHQMYDAAIRQIE